MKAQLLIASWLDQRQVDRIADAEPDRVDVMYAPELLPIPRYEADHYAPRRDLRDADLARWRSMVARAVISFDFDWDRPSEFLANAPNLRWVQSPSSGIGPMLERIGVMGSTLTVTNAAGIHAQPLAEFVLMAALHFAKEVPRIDAWKAKKAWVRFCGYELAGSRMLLVGLGGAGARIAQLCSAVGVEVIGHRRSTAPPPPGVSRMVTLAELDAELPNVDYVALAAPDTVETKNFLDRRRLSLLPPKAVIINVGRGSLIDEPAMIEMLASNKLRGAALDVFAKEPLPDDNPLWSMPNVIVSPHSASTVVQENDRLTDLFIDNLRRFLAGEPLVNLFDHARKY
ncbi:MAG: D-2-hydroxyacid dehydrogenase [Gemmatimonadaceae bacterium]